MRAPMLRDDASAKSDFSPMVAAFWLIYLPFLFVGPYITKAPARIWLVTAGTVLLFLPLYAGVCGWSRTHPARSTAAVVAIALMGVWLVPLNLAGSTYVIYSAGMAGLSMPIRSALVYVFAAAAALFLALVLVPGPLYPWMTIQVIVVLVVGGGNTMAARERRRHRQLLRAQEDVEEMAKLAERERIARDLHDVLGHTLSVIALKSELASRIADSDPARAVVEIREVERVARAALTDVRGAVEGYRQRGLRGELQAAAQVLQSAGVRLHTAIASVEMDPRHETVFALAVREAVTNIVRHAGATECRVELAPRDGGVELRVRDDGRGGIVREGHGLTGMRERVQALGGHASVRDARDGVTLVVRMPMSSAAPVSAAGVR
jgi:two-component system sensor histidine kinase DesK